MCMCLYLYVCVYICMCAYIHQERCAGLDPGMAIQDVFVHVRPDKTAEDKAGADCPARPAGFEMS